MTWIRVEPGERFSFDGGGEHEEGFHHWEESIEMCDHPDENNEFVILLESHTNSRDCDGPLETWTTYKWDRQDQIWQSVEGRQRDAFAESMNY